MRPDLKWVASGLFCLCLGLTAKAIEGLGLLEGNGIHALQWLMTIAGAAQIGWGMWLGIKGHD